MALDAYPVRSGIPEVYKYIVRMTGTGASVPTQNYPAASSGVTLARTSAGLFTLTWTDDPGTYLGITGQSFGGTTTINMLNHEAREVSYASKVLTFTVYDDTAVDDLEAAEFLTLEIAFSRSSLA